MYTFVVASVCGNIGSLCVCVCVCEVKLYEFKSIKVFFSLFGVMSRLQFGI